MSLAFRAERDALAKSLATAARATTARSIPVLAGVRLGVTDGTLSIAASDLDLTIQTEVDVSAAEDGVTVVPAKLTADIVKSLAPGAVTLKTTDEELTITSGRAEFSLRTFSVADFPKLPVWDGDTITVPVAEFSEALRQVVPAAATDDTRPMLCGVLLASESSTGLRMVATDSYRLALRELTGTAILSEGQKVLVPARALSELQRAFGPNENMDVRLADNEAAFRVGPVTITTRLIQGDFPNYNQLIPQNQSNRLIVGVDALTDAIGRMRTVVREATTPVRLSLTSEGIELSVATADVGNASEKVDAKYEGTDLVVGFNGAYLTDAISAVGTDEVAISLTDNLKPVVVGPSESDGSFIHLLMPVRLP